MAELMQDKASDVPAAGPKSALMEVVQAMHKLTLEEKAQLLEYLSRALQYGIRQEAFKDVSWEEFVERSFGSMPNLRFGRDELGNREVYEVLE
ncbi:MAG: hypothetical protein OXI30_08380 [Chloroflexota bacterium]|nr:hypothetical protein [Chloroflexota bacterium]